MGKTDKTPALGEFTGNPGVTQIPVDPTQETAVAELFFGDSVCLVSTVPWFF
jgi:hypothetical protein